MWRPLKRSAGGGVKIRDQFTEESAEFLCINGSWIDSKNFGVDMKVGLMKVVSL